MIPGGGSRPDTRSAPGRPPGASGGSRVSRGAIGARAQIACLVELAAPNPGNVRPGHDLPGLSATELMMSAAAIGPALSAAGDRPLGETLLRAVRDTRRWVDTNTNLGIVLLLAPLARAAALAAGSDAEDAGPPGGDDARATDAGRPDGIEDGALWEALEAVLGGTTVRDAELAYRAIREAEPGGLGRVDDQDVSGTPTVPLRETMRRAAGRDTIAEQYDTGYRLVRTAGVPAVRDGRTDGLGWVEAAHRAFVRLMAERPDSLVARKFGRAEAEGIRQEAERLLALGPPESARAAGGWADLDRRLRSASPPRNPGTTADLTAAAVFAALLTDDPRNSSDHGQ